MIQDSKFIAEGVYSNCNNNNIIVNVNDFCVRYERTGGRLNLSERIGFFFLFLAISSARAPSKRPKAATKSVFGCQYSGVSPAAGRLDGQFDR